MLSCHTPLYAANGHDRQGLSLYKFMHCLRKVLFVILLKVILHFIIFNSIDVGLTILSDLLEHQCFELAKYNVHADRALGKNYCRGHAHIGVAEVSVDSHVALWELLQDCPVVNTFCHMYICVL